MFKRDGLNYRFLFYIVLAFVIDHHLNVEVANG